LNPKFTGSNLAEDDGFLRALKVCSTTFFRGEVKLASHVIRFLGMLKIATA
jgi:hypothetical protein